MTEFFRQARLSPSFQIIVRILAVVVIASLLFWLVSLLPRTHAFLQDLFVVTNLQMLFIIIFSMMTGALLLYAVLKSRHDQLQQLANIDELTGLYNSRFLNKLLRRQLEQARQHHRTFSLILLDIDNFKQINDKLGYQCGDATLKQLSSIIGHPASPQQHTAPQRPWTRKGDMVFRYKLGDEFMIFLPDTHAMSALNIAERIRKRTAEYRFQPLPDKDREGFHISLSLAVVEVDRKKDTLDSLLHRTNALLAHAKRIKNHTKVEIGYPPQGNVPTGLHPLQGAL